MTIASLAKLNFTKIAPEREELRFGDDLVLDLSKMTSFDIPPGDLQSFNIELALLQNGDQVTPVQLVQDGDRGNDFAQRVIFGVIENQDLDNLRRGIYQIYLRVSWNDITRSAILAKRVFLGGNNPIQ